MLARAEAGPTGEVLRRRELTHVDADLGNDHFGGAPVHPGDRIEAVEGRGVGAPTSAI
jgi:hypothetical protein